MMRRHPIPVGSGSPASRRHLRRTRLTGNGWIAGAALLVVLGAAGSVLAARAVAHSDSKRAERAFAAASTNIAETEQMAIQHQLDLVLSTTAFFVSNPKASAGKFNQWMRIGRVYERYPEIVNLAKLAVVTASQLPAFAAEAVKHPVGPLAPDGTFQVIPPGSRPYYCFATISGRPSNVPAPPAALDLCAGGNGKRLLASRDSGVGTYEPIPLAKIALLGIQVPLYRDGVVLDTVTARRRAYLGSIGLLVDPSVVMNAAIKGHPGTTVTLRFLEGATPAVFTSGVAPRGARSLTIDLHNGWTVQTSAAVVGTGIFANGDAVATLFGGIALSLLLGLLGAVLATGRARALRLVGKQTVVLHEQADELRESVTELETAQAVKDEFLALVTHELRTPLTSILGFSELLKEEKLDGSQRTCVEVIDRNSSRLLSLVEDLLLMAQIQSGGLPLELRELMLDDLIASSGEAARPFAASKEIAIDVDVDPTQSVSMRGDAVRLGQVIDNLVSNAIKYTPNGGDVSITMRRTGPTATIAVSDTGIGIPAAEQSQMFSRFFRTSNARLAGVDGTGLGLAITRGIVESHGGTIAFDSVEGRGTTFRVTLPLHDSSGLASAA